MTPVSPSPFTEAYVRAGLPLADLDAWVEALLRYPRSSRHAAWLSEDDRTAAYLAAKGGSITNDHDSVSRRAWQLCVEREGAQVLSERDADEVSLYVSEGGTLVEASGYLDAVAGAQSPIDDLWMVWTRFEVSFSAARFGAYRRMGVSPADLEAFVKAGWFTGSSVASVYRWGIRVCPDAPFLVAAAYRGCELPVSEIPAWEERRRAGQDVLAALAVLAALNASPGQNAQEF